MRSSLLLCGVLASACTRPGAVPVCSPPPSFTAPVLRCAAPGTAEAMAAPVPEPPTAPPPPRVELREDTLNLPETIQFEVDSATLVERSKSVLDEVARLLEQHPEIARVELEGHTDSTATKQHNQRLSEQRAAAVKAYLVDKGIAADRLTTRGYGEDRPVGDNGTEEGRFKNRRVEFKILLRR